MLFKQLCDMISSLSCHADTILDHILTQMDEKLESVGDRDLVNGRGPRRSRGRDGVGTCSDGTNPNLFYRHCRHI